MGRIQGRIAGLGVVAGLMVAAAVFTAAVAAAPAASDRVEVRKAEALLKRASSSLRAKKLQDATETFQEAQQTLSQLAAKDSRELAALTAPLEKQASRLREQLEAAGAKLPEPKPVCAGRSHRRRQLHEAGGAHPGCQVRSLPRANQPRQAQHG